MDAAQPTHRKKTADPASDVACKQTSQRSRKPAYLQCKLALSHPQDAEEREADQVAREVSNSPRAADVGPHETEEMVSSATVAGARRLSRRPRPAVCAARAPVEEAEPVHTQLRRSVDAAEGAASEEEAPIRMKLAREPAAEEDKLQTWLRRQSRTEAQEDDQTLPAASLMRTIDDEEAARARVFREDDGLAGAPSDGEPTQERGVDARIEERITARRGAGDRLPEAVREDMEVRFGQDFSRVSIHTDAEAAELCAEIHARAFAVGNDVFFAPGEYAPETEAGRELLAHELTHVVQQGDGARPKLARQSDSGTGGGAASTPPPGVTPIEPSAPGTYEFRKSGKHYRYAAGASPKELHLPEVGVPGFKRRHSAKHSSPMVRDPGARNTDQRNTWRTHFETAIDTPLNTLLERAEARMGFSGDGEERTYFFRGTRNSQLMVFGTRAQLKPVAIFPFWDAAQQTTTFQVDHCREDQLGGEDAIDNYELLEAGANSSSGSSIARGVNGGVNEAVAVLQSPYYRGRIGGGAQRISGNPSYIKERYRLGFGRAVFNLGGVANGDRHWSKDQIAAGGHLSRLNPLTAMEIQRLSRDGRTMLFTSPSGGVPIRAPSAEGQRIRIWPRVFTNGALQIAEDSQSASLAVDAYKASENPQGLHASYSDVVFHFSPVPGMDAWAINKSATLAEVREGAGGVFQSLRLPGLSPIRIDDLDLDPGTGFVGRGKLLPTVPLLADADIDIVVQGASVRLQKTFGPDDIAVPAPFVIRHSAITVFAGNEGLGAEGTLAFGIDRIGEGEVNATLATGSGFALDGHFGFDERLFGRGSHAEVRVGYRQNRWAIGGSVSIPEGRVPGVRSATISVDYDEASGFTAEGQAELSIPGVESGTLSVRQVEGQGFEIGGQFDLSADTPGIRSGQISVTVSERPGGEGYAVSASGTAQPDLPGIDSQLSVSYDDGAFTAEASGSYRRGMLSGQASVGATNRALDENGQPTGEAGPNSPVVVFGSGQVTVQIAPWLQGTVGIRFAPDGEVTVSGEIGIPGAVEIFARRQIEKSLFNIAVQVPIVPGIVAEIGGGLSAQAGIGPGMLERLSLGITYNPAQEADTRVTGNAQLRVPADAGLRLAVRAGVGIGITGASVTGGLEVGGTLGVEGAAEAAVEVDWTPAQGLDLRANLSVHAQPSFTFDISGYVSARALGVSVYEERWQLASYTFGSDYRFGISLPVHYREGEPFQIGLDDVRFEVPNVDPGRILRGLIGRIV